jgi:hypothetical protein
MIKARGTIDGKDTVILGFSDENIDRLRDDEPIMFDGAPYGIPMQVVIMWGKDEGALAKKLGVRSSNDDRVKLEDNAP